MCAVREKKLHHVENLIKLLKNDYCLKPLSDQARIQGGGHGGHDPPPPKLSYYLQKFDQDFNAEIAEKQIWEVPQGVIGLREQRWHHALSWCQL